MYKSTTVHITAEVGLIITSQDAVLKLESSFPDLSA